MNACPSVKKCPVGSSVHYQRFLLSWPHVAKGSLVARASAHIFDAPPTTRVRPSPTDYVFRLRRRLPSLRSDRGLPVAEWLLSVNQETYAHRGRHFDGKQGRKKQAIARAR